VIRAVETAFSKLGDTEFVLASLDLRNPEGLFAPASLLNDLRRNLADELTRRLADTREQRTQCLPEVTFPGGALGEHWSLMTDQPALLADFPEDDGPDEFILDISRAPWPEIESAIAQIPPARLRLALPALLRQADETEIQDRIRALRDQGHTRWQIANLAGLDLLEPRAGLDLTADWPLYSLNTPAMQTLDGLGLSAWTLSPEDGRRNLAQLLAAAPGRATVLVYQDTPLAISATCIFASANGFCPGKRNCEATEQEWTNRSGDRLLAINDRCRSIILNDRPFSLSGRLAVLRAAGARRFRADFLWRRYDPAEARYLWREIRANHSLPHTHPANFERELDQQQARTGQASENSEM
jgi:putative protease